MLRFKRTSEFLEWLRKLKDRDAKAKIEAHLDGFLACKPGISMPGLHAFSYC